MEEEGSVWGLCERLGEFQVRDNCSGATPRKWEKAEEK